MVSSLPFVLIMYMVGSKFIVHGFSKSLIPVNHYYLQHKYICKSCRGKRVVLGTKSVKLNIMPGISFFVVNLYIYFFFGSGGCIAKFSCCCQAISYPSYLMKDLLLLQFYPFGAYAFWLSAYSEN